MFVANALSVLVVGLFLALIWALFRPNLARRRVTRRRMAEPRTHGDYSDEVTDEHFKRIAELVDQGQFENAEGDMS